MAYLYRILYRKNGPLKFISHLDLNLLIRRVLLRTKMPLELTQGYNPRIKISFGPALPLGLEGWQELMEISLLELLAEEEIKELINKVAPSGFRVVSVKSIANKTISLSKLLKHAFYLIYIIFNANIEEEKKKYYLDNIELINQNILKQEKIKVIKKTKEGFKEIDLRPYIHKSVILSKTKEKIIIRLIINIESGGGINPYLFTEIFSCYGKGDFLVDKIIREKFILNKFYC